MIVKKLNECGYDEALLGLSLSFYDHAEQLATWWTPDKKERAVRRAKALAHKGGGHNKFLASIQVWLYVQAPRAWWSEFDTYKVGVTANSSSTMHTLSKRQTVLADYEEGTSLSSIFAFNGILESLPNITELKMNLPEGWLQERQICLNYMSLQNIIRQRTGHRLKMWDMFISAVLDQVGHPEFLKVQDVH